MDNTQLPGLLTPPSVCQHPDNAGAFCAAVLIDISEALTPKALGLEMVCVRKKFQTTRMKQHHHRNEAEEHDALVLLLEARRSSNTVQGMDALFSERWLFLAGLSFPQVGRLTEHVESFEGPASIICPYSVKELHTRRHETTLCADSTS